MASTIKYSKSPVDNLVRLQVKNGVDDKALIEIQKCDYDTLWLYSGNFEAIASVDLSLLPIRKVRIQSDKSQNVSWVENCPELESLSIKGKIKGKIDFSKLNRLTACELDWCASTKSIISSQLALKSLGLSKYSGALTDFCRETSSSISSLGVTGSMKNLDGVASFSKLEALSLWNMKNLTDISQLSECKSLRTLQIEACDKIEYQDILGKLKNLETIFFENKSLSSLNCFPMDNIKYIRLGDGTVIEDGNIEVAMEFPLLESMSFSKKKGYQYSAEEINAMLKERAK